MMYVSPGMFIMIGGATGAIVFIILAFVSKSRWKAQRAELLRRGELLYEPPAPKVPASPSELKCPSCGAPVQENMAFCEKCGAGLK